MSMHHSPRYGTQQHNARMRLARKRNILNRLSWVVLVVIILGVIVGIAALYNSSKGTETCTVQSKERTTHTRDGNSTQQKLVYTEDCGVLTVDDAWYAGKFNSADTYGMLQEGQKYKFETIGWRVGFFSAYPNILSAEPVKG